ncbi:uncharacterized protein PFL1_02165 [Pseudozyma flocculosa PF-1]|uniref:uncharacterized protein n=1 Tax=Pseudozyma flocculosa PF-1 TaxID=1277687 RepID=UPI00045609AF|nr:uncharacterized protein PFL1_02165 [Pseudozyma flocculosa PF-1]EPQ30048.1 hypothetical protein PFL1_02165 [Pseudozyma flocculosa PF-1]
MAALLCSLSGVEAGHGRRIQEPCTYKHDCYMLAEGGGPEGYGHKVTCAIPLDAQGKECKRKGDFQGLCKYDGELDVNEAGCECGIKNSVLCTESSPFDRLNDLTAYYSN